MRWVGERLKSEVECLVVLLAYTLEHSRPRSSLPERGTRFTRRASPNTSTICRETSATTFSRACTQTQHNHRTHGAQTQALHSILRQLFATCNHAQLYHRIASIILLRPIEASRKPVRQAHLVISDILIRSSHIASVHGWQDNEEASRQQAGGEQRSW